MRGKAASSSTKATNPGSQSRSLEDLRILVMENGRVVDMIPNSQLDANMAKLHDYLGV